MLWWGTLLPRIHAFVPTGTILEIAPGFGRITHYLKDLCSQLIVVDLTQQCIEACKKRFASSSHITYHLNDGKSLEMIAEQSVDFAFSFDSLVHVEADVMEAYISQLGKILKPNGVALLHHSNAADYRLPEGSEETSAWQTVLQMWRGQSVSAAICEQYCEKANLQCIIQELINWGTEDPNLIDCFSIFTPKGSSWARPNSVFHNPQFTAEMSYLRKLRGFYSTNALMQTQP